jgi:hypothetical protein
MIKEKSNLSERLISEFIKKYAKYKGIAIDQSKFKLFRKELNEFINHYIDFHDELYGYTSTNKHEAMFTGLKNGLSVSGLDSRIVPPNFCIETSGDEVTISYYNPNDNCLYDIIEVEFDDADYNKKWQLSDDSIESLVNTLFKYTLHIETGKEDSDFTM